MSSKQPVTSDSLFWKRVIQEVHNKSMQQLMFEQKYAWTHERDERPYVTMKKNWMPTMTTFSIDLGVAEKFGLIEPSPRSEWVQVGTQSAVHPPLCDLR